MWLQEMWGKIGLVGSCSGVISISFLYHQERVIFKNILGSKKSQSWSFSFMNFLSKTFWDLNAQHKAIAPLPPFLKIYSSETNISCSKKFEKFPQNEKEEWVINKIKNFETFLIKWNYSKSNNKQEKYFLCSIISKKLEKSLKKL